MPNKSYNYIFIDESGDPGKPYKLDSSGNKIPTGASMFYILSALCVDSQKLFAMEDMVLAVKKEFGYKKEIKSTEISLPLYKKLLNIINLLDINVYYRLVNKTTYKGKFAVSGDKRLHNVFDEYNLFKLAKLSIKFSSFTNTEIIIDRADRRLLGGKFDNCNDYLMNGINTKTIKKISHVTHVNSEYVNAMQMSDLISGAIKDYFTGKNKELQKIVKKSLLKKIY